MHFKRSFKLLQSQKKRNVKCRSSFGKSLVRPTRFELVAFCFGGKRSIQAELRAHCCRPFGYSLLYHHTHDSGPYKNQDRCHLSP